MKTNGSRSIQKFVLLIGILILLTANLSCFKETTTNDFASPLEVKLSLSSAPALNRTAELTCKAFSRFGVPDIIFQVYLPEGLALVDGNLSWLGSLAENQSFELKATVKAVKTGNWTIEAFAKNQQPQPGFTLDRVGQMGKLYLSVSEDSAVISEWPFESDTTPDDTTPKCEQIQYEPETPPEQSDNVNTPS